jgi:methylmalonyl-CoA/ethylmalonyl-CoA epimerase
MEQKLPLPFLKDGVAQIAMVVRDLEEIVEQYYQLFGIGNWQFYTYQKPLLKKMSYHGQSVEHSFRIALSYFGPMRIEVIEIKEGDSIYRDFIEKHGYGVQHLGFLVEDMQAALAQARAAGLEMIQDGSGFGLDGDGHYAYLNTEDSLGVTIELIQRPKRRHQPEKILYPEK